MWGFLVELIMGLLKWAVAEANAPRAMEVGRRHHELRRRLIERVRRHGWKTSESE